MIREIRDSVSIKENLIDYETREIWNETGFTPSVYYIYLIETLHRKFSSGYKINDEFIHHTLGKLKNYAASGCIFFNLASRDKMKSYAESCAIDTDNYDDCTIMTMITSCIISDYLSEKSTDQKYFSGIKISEIIGSGILILKSSSRLSYS